MSEQAAPVSLELATSNTTSSSDSNPAASNPAVSNAGLWAALDRYYAGEPDPHQLSAGVASALLPVPVRPGGAEPSPGAGR